jgi:hypothetical protein
MKRKSKKSKRIGTKRSNPQLWKKVVDRVKRGSRGGKPGQWSARKAQLAVLIYKNKGGSYSGSKSRNNSLVRWTRQKWRTISGKPSVVGRNATGERYLPSAVIKRLGPKKYASTTRLKRRSLRLGKQYSKQPKGLLKKGWSRKG